MSLRVPGLFVFILCSLCCTAQKGFVEITATDTVMVKAEEFLFRLTVSPNISYPPRDTAALKDPLYYTKLAEHAAEKAQQERKDIENTIRTAGFTINPRSVNETISRDMSYNNLIMVQVRGLDSLKAFYNFIKTVKNVKPLLQSYRSKSDEEAYKRLFKKSVAKARERAKYIASVEGKVITGLISIKDNRYYTPTGWRNYPSYDYGASITTSTIDDFHVIATYEIQNSVTAQFSWK